MDRNPISPTIRFAEFEKVDFRVGTIIKAEGFPKAKQAAYKLWIDLGLAGIKPSRAQITTHYKLEELIGKAVLWVVNLEPKKIADFISEVLFTGFSDENGNVVLSSVDKKISNRARLF